MIPRRRSLVRPTAKIEGIGLHTGAPSWVRLLPSEKRGLLFRGPSGEARIDAGYVVDTKRCTVIDVAGQRLSTVEHLMAALAGTGITDAVIEFEGPEIPIMDGSAKTFVDAVNQAGVEEVDSGSAPLTLNEVIEVREIGNSYIAALPADKFSITVLLEYPEHPKIGVQLATFSGSDFDSEIAPARTYGFLSEFDHIRAQGLASGASLENCVALNDDGSADARTPLRFDNELARHKLLDVMGDLALVGRPLQAQIVALRPGHAVNCTLARHLAALI